MTRRRVVITGLGIVSPVGNSVEQPWQNILAGRSGIDRITRFDVSSFPVQIAGEVRDFDITQYISPKDARRMDTFIHFGMAAAIQAVRDAGLDTEQADSERIGVAIGSGIGSENRAGIGIASVGGILVAGLLTMTVLPLIYTLFTGRPKGEALAKSGQPCED